MFRFTIRDVLWLTVVVALAVGWWISGREQQRMNGELRDVRMTLKLNEVVIASQEEDRRAFARRALMAEEMAKESAER